MRPFDVLLSSCSSMERGFGSVPCVRRNVASRSKEPECVGFSVGGANGLSHIEGNVNLLEMASSTGTN